MKINLTILSRRRAFARFVVCTLGLSAGRGVGVGADLRAADAGGAFQPRQISSHDLKPRVEWRNVGRTTPEACFETARWADSVRDIDVLVTTLAIDDDALAKAQQTLERLPAEQRERYRTAERLIATLMTRGTPMTGIKVLALLPHPNRSADVVLHTLWQYEDGRIRENKNVSLRLTPDGWRQPVNARTVDMLLRSRLNDERRGPGIISGQLRPSPAGELGARLATGLVSVDTLRDRGNATAIAALETLFAAKARRDLAVLERLITVKPEARAKAEAKLASLSEDAKARLPDVTTPERMVIFDWLTSTREMGIQVDTETALTPDRTYFSGHRQDALGVSNFDLLLRRTETGWKWFMSDTWGPAGFAGIVSLPPAAR